MANPQGKGASLRQRETSISAHVVQMGTVTMAFAELDVLCGILIRTFRGFDESSNTGSFLENDTEKAVAREFVEAVETLR